MKNLITILSIILISFSSIGQTYSTDIQSKDGKEYTVFTFTNNSDKTYRNITIKSTYSNDKYTSKKSLKFDVNLHPGQTIKGDLYDYYTYLINKTDGGYSLKNYEVIFE